MNPEFYPVALALAASVLFGITQLTAKRGLDTVDPQTGALLILSVATGVFWLTSPIWLKPENLFSPGFWIFCLNGLLHPMLSMYCALEATRRTHATVAATLSATAPLFAAASAFILLGEVMSVPVMLATTATVLGIITLSWVPEGMRKVMLVAVMFATVTAIVRGVVQGTGKYGLTLTYDPPLAAAMSFTVSVVCSAIIYRFTRGALPRRIPSKGLRWFAITGSVNAIAMFCMYGALGTGRVTVVAPIVASAPIFTLIAGRALFGERLTGNTVTGVALVMSGIITLAYFR